MWGQSKYPSTYERINRIWYVHTMECYLAVKLNTDLFYKMDKPEKHHAKQKKACHKRPHFM